MILYTDPFVRFNESLAAASAAIVKFHLTIVNTRRFRRLLLRRTPKRNRASLAKQLLDARYK